MTRLKRRKDLPSQHGHDVRFGTPLDAAEYRAKRIAEHHPDTIIEIGAGAGFQTSAFAKHARVIAVDIDGERMKRGKFPANAACIAGDALAADIFERIKEEVKGKVVIFLDPARPAASDHRKLSDIEPDINEFIALYSTISPDIAIELPPFLQDIPLDCEREYLSINGKLNRLTIYCGSLKRCERSVVSLPQEERLEHDGSTPLLVEQHVQPRYLLEPDAALEQADLVPVALNVPFQAAALGKKRAYLTEVPVKFFIGYRVLAIGKEQVRRSLARCGTIIIHGSMSQDEQRELLKELNRLCKGSSRLHLFIGNQWILCRKLQSSP
jgi:hypothetical protein